MVVGRALRCAPHIYFKKKKFKGGVRYSKGGGGKSKLNGEKGVTWKRLNTEMPQKNRIIKLI